MIQEFHRDIERCRSYGDNWLRLTLNPSLWLIFWYRLGYWLYTENKNRLIRLLCRPPYFFGSLLCEIVMGMRLDPSAKIGPGLYIGHYGGIRINMDTQIGENCSLTHNVTIGTKGLGKKGSPRIGNNVYIGTGATLIGHISVGDGARIAANTLVTRNVPAGATVMGVPGRIVKRAPSAIAPTTAPSEESAAITLPELARASAV
jgi:serine O-acetyltransferase